MFNITNKDKIAIKLGTQKNLQGSLSKPYINKIQKLYGRPRL